MSTPRWMRFLLGIDDLLFLCFTYFWVKRVDSKLRPWRIYVCVGLIFLFSYCWYVVIQFSSCHTQNIRLLTWSAQFFSLSHSVIKVKHPNYRSHMQACLLVLWYVEAHPIIKDAPIHIYDRNLVINEHPHPVHIHTHAWHTPQHPSWIFMSVVPQTKTLAVRGHYPLTQAAGCDDGDSGDATQDLFTGACRSSVNTLISLFCWNTIWHHYGLKQHRLVMLFSYKGISQSVLYYSNSWQNVIFLTFL